MSKHEFAFSRINFILLGVAIAVILLGFVLMSGAGSTETTFNPAIFDTRHIVIAPAVCLAGYLFLIVAILYRPKHEMPAADELNKTSEPLESTPEA